MNPASKKTLKDLLVQKIELDINTIFKEIGIDQAIVSYNGDREVIVKLPFVRGQEKDQSFTVYLDFLNDLRDKGYETKIIHADKKEGLILALLMRKKI